MKVMKIEGRAVLKCFSLCVCVLICAMNALPSFTVSQQESKPITKDDLIRSCKPGRLERRTAAEYIDLIEHDKVDFSLTQDDEQKIRRACRYLGKKGLDYLIAALKSNYRPVVQLQPTPSTTLIPITTPREHIKPPALQSFDFNV